MTLSRFRAVALVATALLVLGGCAVPGKGEPGVVATYRDRVITDSDITTVQLSLNDLYSGPNAGEDLTLLLMGQDAVAIADELGYGQTDQELLDMAGIWIAYATKGQVTDIKVTPRAIEVVRVVEAINLLMHDPDGLIALTALVKDIEENSTISPRYGAFTVAAFGDSVDSISKFITKNEIDLSIAQFSVWKDVNGFVMTDQPDWISGG